MALVFVEAMRRQVGLSPGWLCMPPATCVTSPLHKALAGGSSSFTAPGFYSVVEPGSERALACSSGWLAVQQELSAAEVAQGQCAGCEGWFLPRLWVVLVLISLIWRNIHGWLLLSLMVSSWVFVLTSGLWGISDKAAKVTCLKLKCKVNV